jgi:23S rRNA (cytosine1962-C5)-methyltransferase
MSDSFAIHSLNIKAGQKIFQRQSCLYSNQIEQIPLSLLEGERCSLVRTGPQRLPAVFCRDQLMAVRFFPSAWTPHFDADKISAQTLEGLIFDTLSALSKRKSSLLENESEAYRWVHGDADGLPGIVIDHYGSLVVIQCGSQFGDFLLPSVLKALQRATGKPIFERSSGQIRALEKLPERTRWIREPQQSAQSKSSEIIQTHLAGLNIGFRPQKCQKTGLFIDQRENLRMFKSLAEQAKTRTMLDLCSYVGAWSCAGARAGMSEFTLVDQDKDALEMSVANISLNTIQDVKPKVTRLHGDLFEILSGLAKQDSVFDAVVADPPAFTKSAKHVPEARRAYQRLTKLASKLVGAGGIYVACSCSRHIGEEEFYEIVSSALDDDDWIYLGRGRQSPDHTVLATDKQSLYLKALYFQRRNSLPSIRSNANKARGGQR